METYDCPPYVTTSFKLYVTVLSQAPLKVKPLPLEPDVPDVPLVPELPFCPDVPEVPDVAPVITIPLTEKLPEILTCVKLICNGELSPSPV